MFAAGVMLSNHLCQRCKGGGSSASRFLLKCVRYNANFWLFPVSLIQSKVHFQSHNVVPPAYTLWFGYDASVLAECGWQKIGAYVNLASFYVVGVGKNRHRENKRTQSTTQEYNVETPKPEKKPRSLSKPTTRE
ncbi:unnamed protein product [Trifolium pratense]|uniref:Uncharacterized protein n=1 Tax=Trifolium pratense TaxID=57577 RepID=A0ACB0KR12_TRIPR|nr:unnamed protein product [Trifolium pratense]